MFFFFFFFLKQKTAYEIEYGLVGSERCIRERCEGGPIMPACMCVWRGSHHACMCVCVHVVAVCVCVCWCGWGCRTPPYNTSCTFYTPAATDA